MTSKDVTRRRIMKTMGTAAIAGAVARNVGGAATPARPRIPTDYSPNLDRDEISKFMASASMRWEEPKITRDDYAERDVAQRKLIDMRSKTPAGDPIKLFWAMRETYEVTQGGQVIDHFDVVVAYEQQVALEFKRALVLRKNLDPNVAKKVEDFFVKYDPAIDGDPWDYAKARMTADPSITSDSFSVEYVFSIAKIGTSVPHHEKRDAALALFTGNSKARIFYEVGKTRSLSKREDHSLAEYLHGERVGVPVPVKSTLIGKPPTDILEDPVHETDQKGVTPKKLIDDALMIESTALGCGERYKTDQWPLLTLLYWPEFKFAWKDVSMDIGCGIRIVLRLPWLYVRIAHLDLWVYVRTPTEAQGYEKVIAECLTKSALSPAVLAVALVNFPSGVTAFLALFTECITSHALQTFSCLIPGLALISAAPDWGD